MFEVWGFFLLSFPLYLHFPQQKRILKRTLQLKPLSSGLQAVERQQERDHEVRGCGDRQVEDVGDSWQGVITLWGPEGGLQSLRRGNHQLFPASERVKGNKGRENPETWGWKWPLEEQSGVFPTISLSRRLCPEHTSLRQDWETGREPPAAPPQTREEAPITAMPSFPEGPSPAPGCTGQISPRGSGKRGGSSFLCPQGTLWGLVMVRYTV